MTRPRPVMTRVVAGVATLGMIALAAPAAASARVATARLGQVSATLTFTGTTVTAASVHLKITDGGRTVFDRAVDRSRCRGCVPDDLSPRSTPVRVIDLEGTGRPDVVLGLFSGGAHCCYTDQVYRVDPSTRKVSMSSHDFLDAGAFVQGVDGAFRFLSADERFAYAFASFASSGAPIQIWKFAGGRFTDVTDAYPALITADAAEWFKEFKAGIKRRDTEGLITAWAADEERLGNGALVTSTLQAQLRAGHLESLSGPPTGGAFITALMKLLRRDGYIG